MLNFANLKDQIRKYGLYLFEEPEIPENLDANSFLYMGEPFERFVFGPKLEVFVCGPNDPNFYYDRENLKFSPLKNASLENLAAQVYMRIDPFVAVQDELFPFYSLLSTNELCAAFLLKFRDFEYNSE